MTKTNGAMVTGILTAAVFSMANISAFSGASAEEAVKVVSACAPVQSASVLAVDGDVFTAGAKGYVPVAANAVLGAGDQLVVGPRSSARVALGAGNDLALKENSELLLVQGEDGLCARLSETPAIEAAAVTRRVTFEEYLSKWIDKAGVALISGVTIGGIVYVVISVNEDDEGEPASL